MIKTFRLVDVTGYFNNAHENEEFYKKYFTSCGEISLEVVEGEGWIDGEPVIMFDEWIFLKEVR